MTSGGAMHQNLLRWSLKHPWDDNSNQRNILEFTPLEFETRDINFLNGSLRRLEFTPLEFETQKSYILA